MFDRDKVFDRKAFAKGEMIFRQGDEGHEAYIVQTGTVHLFKMENARKVSWGVVSEGGLFGEMAVLDGSPRLASAEAVDDVILICISAKNFREKREKMDGFSRALLNILIENVRNTHSLYAPRARSFEDHLKSIARVSKGLRGFVINSCEMATEADVVLHQLDTIDNALSALYLMRDTFRPPIERRRSTLLDDTLAEADAALAAQQEKTENLPAE